SDEKLGRARELGADASVNHAEGDVTAAVKEVTGGAGVDVVLEHVGEATWQRSLQAARPGGRIVVCGATSGPKPPAALHRVRGPVGAAGDELRHDDDGHRLRIGGDPPQIGQERLADETSRSSRAVSIRIVSSSSARSRASRWSEPLSSPSPAARSTANT